MKNSTIRYIGVSLIAAGLLTFSSCDALKGIPSNNQASGKPQQTGSNKKQKGDKKTPSRNVLPQDREQFIKDKSAKTFTPEDLQKGVVAGDWAIEAVGTQQVAPSAEPPYIKFEPRTSRFYACNGCNYLSGSYRYDASAKTLKFGDDVAATMRYCEDVQFETEINQAISKAAKYSWELKDSQLFLYIYDSHEQLLLTLMHQDFAFLNGVWTVKALNDEPITSTENIQFVIDVAEQKIHGNTGCNVLNGKLITDMDAPNSISFQQLVTTQAQCPDADYENELIVAFEDASSAKPISENKVLLINNHGVVVLELERVK